ncbi:MAG: UDP-N-acetylmuramate dehydrogenase [Chloroflexi bacterium]|nr:UDP-N-acetylmuramate dehydrogenase [Chloroflexota bacterium]
MTAPARFLDALRLKLGAAVQENISLAPYTSARIGGPADVCVTVRSADELAEAVQTAWDYGMPYFVLGGGSNILISDKGVRGLTILNRAKEVRFEEGEPPAVWCESGVVLSNVANRCAARGFSGLEWAATVPGTVGGAVYGNAGAFGGDMAANLIWAEALTKNGREKFSAARMEYGYRASVLKRGGAQAVVLSALLKLNRSSAAEASAVVSQLSERRKSTQPPGASMGSMFKNPAGDYAGRLIEAAGLKGARIGGAEISAKHANFFIAHGETRAGDVRALIEMARKTVFDKFGVRLELEIELIGEWNVER